MATDHNFRIKNGLTVNGTETITASREGSFATRALFAGVDSTGNNVPSSADDLVVSGYGIIGNRNASVYITNSDSNGSVKIGVGGTHNANPKLTVFAASVDINASLRMGSTATEVIDTSRNLKNIGTGSFSGKVTITNASYANHLELVRGSDTLYLTPSGGQLITNGGLSPDVTNTDDLGRSDKYWQDLWLGTSLKMGGTTVIDSSRNLTNIGTITNTGLLHLDLSTSTANSSTGTTFLKIDNYVGGDLNQQKSFIDFVFQDDNTNETPQVRIGAEVGQNGDANSQEKEGSGAFVVYTNNAESTSGDAGASLAERFRVDYAGTVTSTGNIVNDIGNSGDDSFIELKNTGYTGNVTSLRQNADGTRSELNSTERPIYIQAGSGGGSTGAEIRLYANQQLGLTLNASKNATFGGSVTAESLTVGSSSTNPGTVSIHDNSSTNYIMDITGTGTRAYKILGSASSADYYLNIENSGTGGFNLTVESNISMATGHSSGKFAVMSTGVHASYDFYNNGTTYLNGSTIIDNSLSIQGTGAALTVSGTTSTKLRQTTAQAGAVLEFSDEPSSWSQNGTITFRHADTQSYGSGAMFEIGSDQSTTSIVAKGKLYFSEGLYTVPTSGTGVGTLRISSSGNATLGTIASGPITLTNIAVSGAVLATNSSFIMNAQEAGVQILAENSGDWASHLILTNQGNRHYWIHNAPSTASANANKFELRTSTTTTAAQIGGQGSGSTAVLVVDSSGNTNISGTLDTTGNISINAADGFVYLNNDGVGNAGIYVRGIGSSDTLRSHSTDNFRWEVLGSQKMELDSDGRLMVGVTSPNGDDGVTINGGGYIYSHRANAVSGYFDKDNNGNVLTVRYNGGDIGHLGIEGGDSLYIQSNGATGAGLRFHPTNGTILPMRNGAATNNTLDLGTSTVRFKDLYMQGLLDTGDGALHTGGYRVKKVTGSTSGSGVANGFAITSHFSSNSHNYIVELVTYGTGTDTGACYLVYYNDDTASWYGRLVNRAATGSNHPDLDVTTAGVITVYTNHTSTYNVMAIIHTHIGPESDSRPNVLGGHFHWQRNVNDLYYMDGDVGIGQSDPGAKLDVDGSIRGNSLLVNGGSITVPAITKNGDSNTGIYYPADDQIGISVGASRKLYFTSQNAYFQNLSGGIDASTMHVSAGSLNVEGLVKFGDTAGTPAADIHVYGTGNNYLRLRGTASNDYEFDLQGTSSTGLITFNQFDLQTNNNIIIDGDSKYLIIENHAETDTGIIFNDGDATTGGNWRTQGSSSQAFKIQYHCGNETLIMGHDDDSYAGFNFGKGGALTCSGNITAYSDERLKENIETLDGSKVLEMRGVSFTKEGKEGSGVIAQELEKVAPELVSETGGYKSVAYGNLTGYLIEAVKLQQQKIEKLEELVEKLISEK